MKPIAEPMAVRDPKDWLPTRRSLLSRLKNWDDQESWREFFSTYWKLIYCVAVKSGLTHTEAEDVVQETVLTVAKKMDAFKYDPGVCSFKGWLRHVTRLRILDQLRKRQPPFHNAALQCDDNSRTDTLERVADPSLALNAVWDEEWATNLLDAAMERVKRRVKPAHYQIFHLYAVKAVPAGRVASMLGVTVAQVYLIKQRVSRLLKKEMQRLEANHL